MRSIGFIALMAAVACGGKDKDPDLSPDLVMEDANNYSYAGTMEITGVDVAAQSDPLVDWCSLTTDIRGRAVNPNAVDRLILIELELTQAEALEKIEKNDLTQQDTVTQWIFQNETAAVCSANLSEFAILSNNFRPEDFVESTNTWLLSATYFDPEYSQFDFAMTKFVTPVAAETNTDIALTDDSASLDFDADLSAPALQTSASFDSYTLDWSAVTQDVNGAEWDDEKGNRVLIGKVDAKNIGDVEDIFLRVDSEASELYRLYDDENGVLLVSGETSADLMLATDEAGNSFPGFTTDGIWLVGVECTSCTSPAPLLLSVVEVSE